jgi:hypothetical protein
MIGIHHFSDRFGLRLQAIGQPDGQDSQNEEHNKTVTALQSAIPPYQR